MVDSIHIQGFRGLRGLALSGASRINVVVGANNVGKTALLDAIELAVRDGERPTLARLVERRCGGEAVGRASLPEDVRHLFHGHRSASASFQLDTGGAFARTLKVGFVVTPGAESAEVVIARAEVQERIGVFPTASGTGSSLARPAAAVEFLGTERTADEQLRAAWNKLAGEPDEEAVLALVRRVDPKIERIVVAERRLYARVRGIESRVPLESQGDGVMRALGIATHAVRARGGVLLIDEIDRGLHHRSMRSVWELLIPTAAALDVQVFATTHSRDCVEALGWLHRDEPTATRGVSLFRVDRVERTLADGADHAAVGFTPAEIHDAIEWRTELRG